MYPSNTRASRSKAKQNRNKTQAVKFGLYITKNQVQSDPNNPNSLRGAGGVKKEGEKNNHGTHNVAAKGRTMTSTSLWQ